MFRIVCDPSSGSRKLYLTVIRIGSLMFVVCLIGVWQRNFWTSGVCVRYDGLRTSYRTHTPLVQKLRGQTPIKHRTNISKPIRILVKYRFILPDDGSHTIRNMSEWFLILCILTFYTTQILTFFKFCIIKCIRSANKSDWLECHVCNGFAKYKFRPYTFLFVW